MNPSCPAFQSDTHHVPASLWELRQLIQDKVSFLQTHLSHDPQVCVCEGREELWRFAILSQELTFHLQQVQRQTEQELRHIDTQHFGIRGRRLQLTSELFDLERKKTLIQQVLRRSSDLHTSTLCASTCGELQAGVGERRAQAERLLFRERALSALRRLLSQDLLSFRQETLTLRRLTHTLLSPPRRSEAEQGSTSSMQGKTETETETEQHTNNNNMRAAGSAASPAKLPPPPPPLTQEGAEPAGKAGLRRPVGLSLQRAGSVKDLISRFSEAPPQGPGPSLQLPPSSSSDSPEQTPIPSITVTPPRTETQTPTSAHRPVGGGAQGKPQSSDSPADSGMGSESESDTSKPRDSLSEEEPSTPRAAPTSHNPKYQLFLNNELKSNGLSGRDADGPGGGGSLGENGPKLARWETNRLGLNHYRGSLESLASRDWDTGSDRLGTVDSPPRVFNSPYSATTSIDYNPMHRMSEFKMQGGLSPATSELNLYTYNSRSTSPVAMGMGMGTPTIISPRPRFSAYDTLLKRRAQDVTTTTTTQVVPTHYSMRSATLGAPNRKDYIEELTKQLDACQKRNQFLEAESVEMEKERNQIRFEMRGLLVNNEDLLRNNTQLTNEMKRMREQMMEMEREQQSMGERYREMEIEVKSARDMMVEANTQEYAFNYLQQSLKNKIQDAEENLDKQTQHAQTLAEKLWHAERQLEEFEVDKGTRDKKTSELNSTVFRLETELAEALQLGTQNSAEMNLQQKLHEDAQLRVEELEEVLLEKDTELQRLQTLVSKLQGEVSEKLNDKERTLEEEIQLRERIQLQWKQAERTVDDLHMELQTTNQNREDLSKQLKQSQEKMIDLESDLEELQDSEQRWAAKHKRAIEQTEQLQLKLIQEKDLNDQLEMDKASTERQLRELRIEVEELQSSRVQEDVISRTETRLKEMENNLRTEERNKAVLNNTVSKLERRINELSDQMEEEHRIATEQKDLMTQRIRSLKRQLNEAEEEASRKDAQYRHTQRELTEERENNARLQRQLLDQHLQTKRKETLTIRQTLDNLRLDLSVDDEDEDQTQPQENVTKV